VGTGGGGVVSAGSTYEAELTPDTGRLLGSGVDWGNVSSFVVECLLNLEVRLERLDLELSARGISGCSEGKELGVE
jgi:hypothetical protein